MAVKKDKNALKTNYTVIQKKFNMRGSIEFQNPLKMCGDFDGDIKGSSTLYIESGAKIHAHIQVPHLIVYGQIIGNIIASEKVSLHTGSNVVGNIRTPNLEIEDGVVFEGQCEMKQQSAEVQTPANA